MRFKLSEARRVSENESLKDIIKDCLGIIRSTKYKDYIDDNDFSVEEKDATSVFGTMSLLSPGSDPQFKLSLSSYLLDEPEENIKNVVLHEFCHYIVDKMAIESGVYYDNGNGGWCADRDEFNLGGWSAHGRKWKEVARIVGEAGNTEITRLGSDEFHTGVAQVKKDRAKHIYKCSGCGKEYIYQKDTKFTKDMTKDYFCISDDDYYTPHYRCGNCHTSKYWKKVK